MQEAGAREAEDFTARDAGNSFTGTSLGLKNLAEHQGSFKGTAKLRGPLRGCHGQGAWTDSAF